MERSVNVNPFLDKSDKTERLGYVPFEKRLAAIMNAGLQLKSSRDEYFDSFSDEDIKAPPPLPRHLDADLAEVSDLARKYDVRRREIEAKIALLRAEQAAKASQPLADGVSIKSAVNAAPSIDKSA
jgi:hypothetical protein